VLQASGLLSVLGSVLWRELVSRGSRNGNTNMARLVACLQACCCSGATLLSQQQHPQISKSGIGTSAFAHLHANLGVLCASKLAL
jgi:hypothetical protein